MFSTPVYLWLHYTYYDGEDAAVTDSEGVEEGSAAGREAGRGEAGAGASEGDGRAARRFLQAPRYSIGRWSVGGPGVWTNNSFSSRRNVNLDGTRRNSVPSRPGGAREVQQQQSINATGSSSETTRRTERETAPPRIRTAGDVTRTVTRETALNVEDVSLGTSSGDEASDAGTRTESRGQERTDPLLNSVR